MSIETIAIEAVEAAVEPLVTEAVHEVVIKLTAKEAELLKKLFDLSEPLEDWLKKEIIGFIEYIKAKA